jgi:hypothetical protein
MFEELPMSSLLVFRRAAGRPTRDGETWWELVDACASADQPPAGVALTRHSANGATHVVSLAALSTPDLDLLPRLVRELVAALRRTDTSLISIRGGRADVDAALLAEDFLPATDNLFLLHL